MLPRPEYLQEVGRELIIPCEAIGDPAPNITWSKVCEIHHFNGSPVFEFCALTRSCLPSQIGSTPRSPYTVLANGSLLLQPLSKDHQGGWECLATNRVATVSAGTVVMVLGEKRDNIPANFLDKMCYFVRMYSCAVSTVYTDRGGYFPPQVPALMLWLQFLSPQR